MTAIIRGQHVNPDKLKKAKELRKWMTKTEEILRNHLRGNRLNGLHFCRQQVVYGYIADFYCHSARLVVEVDVEIHEPQKDKDQQRDLALINKSLKILRIKNEEIHTDLQNVLNRISKTCGK